jgi:hypothetical protein
MKAILGISLYSCFYLNSKKCYVFLIIAYFYSSMELEKHRTGSARKGGGKRAGGRSDPNNVCTSE